MASLREQVGDLIRHHRDRADLNQSQLAERIGMSQETISRIERGLLAPSFETLVDLASALNVDVRDFFAVGDFVARDGRDDPLVRLVGRLTELSNDDVEWVDRLVATALSRKVRG
ncbi:helix-turn-helix domain-containing protein [Caulobacter endophyticus]|uniref:Transcriptional regulator n=1 Tax=Caulobacter endophyticus TaxID=2172652 RepID=A0A2T9JEJ9_9CAUL|nr:helix-turn-helix transcriptional regulator [Caulobacter endophyticus]PVM82089.1 transcriptional regulator [Caulobacter endophyticus]